jgi:DNA topoisomerase-3
VLSSAVGHLLELIVPEQFEVKRGKWTFAHLPVIPPHFDLRPIEKTESRLKVLKKLLKRPTWMHLLMRATPGARAN